MTDEHFKKSVAYSLDKSELSFVSAAFGLTVTIIALYGGFFPFLWNYVGQVLSGVGITGEIHRSLVVTLLAMLSGSLVNLPLSLYSTFVVEQRHGFNKSTLALFFTDLFKQYLLVAFLLAPTLAGVIRIIQWSGDSFYLYVSLFLLAFQIFLNIIYPTLIQPMFNKFESLEEGALKTDIEALASKVGLSLKSLYVMDGSKRSGHSNAYMFGFLGNKRIVLYDTLIKQSSSEEICATLAHEIGHWKHNHTIKMLILTQLHILLILYSFKYFIHNADFFASFGFTQEQPVIIGLILFQYVLSPIDAVLTFVQNMLSRHFEREADAYSFNLGYDEELPASLIKIHLENMSNVNPDPWFSAYHYSHPPLLERLEAIRVLSEKGKNKKK